MSSCKTTLWLFGAFLATVFLASGAAFGDEQLKRPTKAEGARSGHDGRCGKYAQGEINEIHELTKDELQKHFSFRYEGDVASDPQWIPGDDGDMTKYGPRKFWLRRYPEHATSVYNGIDMKWFLGNLGYRPATLSEAIEFLRSAPCSKEGLRIVVLSACQKMCAVAGGCMCFPLEIDIVDGKTVLGNLPYGHDGGGKDLLLVKIK